MVIADAGYGENGLFRTALTARGFDYIVQVKADTSMYPGDAVYGVGEYSGQGRPRKPGYRTKPIRAEVLAQSLPKEHYRPVSWSHGTKGLMTSRFVAVRVLLQSWVKNKKYFVLRPLAGIMVRPLKQSRTPG